LFLLKLAIFIPASGPLSLPRKVSLRRTFSNLDGFDPAPGRRDRKEENGAICRVTDPVDFFLSNPDTAHIDCRSRSRENDPADA